MWQIDVYGGNNGLLSESLNKMKMMKNMLLYLFLFRYATLNDRQSDGISRIMRHRLVHL